VKQIKKFHGAAMMKRSKEIAVVVKDSSTGAVLFEQYCDSHPKLMMVYDKFRVPFFPKNHPLEILTEIL